MNAKNLVALILVISAAAWVVIDERKAKPSNSVVLKPRAGVELTTREVAYYGDAKGFFAAPTAPGNYPGVVMVHEWWGLNPGIKDMARTLASEGYAVLAVDLYNGEVAADATRARALTQSINKAVAVKNMKAAKAYLKMQGSSKFAALGWCFGGGQVMQLSISGEPLDASIIYYGQLVTDAKQLKAITWPVLGIFGENDQSIKVETVQAFDQALTDAGVSHSVKIYPGVGHAFANPSGANFAPEPTREAWEKTLKFLESSLK